MDEHRFDDLVRMLVASGSRRGAVRALAGIGLSGTLAQLGLQRVAAQCGLVRTSTRRADRCSRRNPCCENARCKNKRCKCEPGWCDANDDGICEEQLGTNANCAACGDACEAPDECTDDFGGKICCRRVRQVCEDNFGGQCCTTFSNAWSCRTIANSKGEGVGGCGFPEGLNFTRCCIVDGGSGSTGNCDCCGTSVYCEGTCIPESCGGLCTKSCTSNADCGSGCFLTCQEEGGAGGPKHCLPPR